MGNLRAADEHVWAEIFESDLNPIAIGSNGYIADLQVGVAEPALRRFRARRESMLSPSTRAEKAIAA